MMTYDDCPSCKKGNHRNCKSDPEYPTRFICTCPVCNALGITNIEFTDELTQESFETNLTNMASFVREMTDEQWKIFKIMVNE